MREEPIKSNPPTLKGVQVDITRPLDHCASGLEHAVLSVMCIHAVLSVICICHVHLVLVFAVALVPRCFIALLPTHSKAEG